MAANVQHLRLRKPNPEKIQAGPQKFRHQGILQDRVRRTARPPWTPSLSLAFRMILLLRVSAAMYSNIQDCDEVYNFWEPLHYLDRGVGFQTWEVSPQYSIRSWAYILLHLPVAWGPVRLFSLDKRQAFFAVRIFFAFISSFCEAKFYRTIVEVLNERVGRYTLFMLIFNAGMWNYSTAFLPSSFAMYANLLAFSYAFRLPTSSNKRRTILGTLFFAIGAIVGWPFALLVSAPFIFEEIFVYGSDRVPPEGYGAWLIRRLRRLVSAALIASCLFIPVIAIDSLAYGRLTIVPWNIIKYNIFGEEGRGPDLYGTEPWYFYILNLLLNFNVLLPLALISIPSLVITYFVDRKRLGFYISSPDQSSPFTLLAIRLTPFYLWFSVLTLQPHKEERFMNPVYPLICFNGATSLYLIKGWFETAFIKVTKSPYKASRSSLFRTFTFSVVMTSTVISISRIFAQSHYYHAPLGIAYRFESEELPRLLNVTGLLKAPPPPTNLYDPKETPRIDLSPIKQFELRLCFGKEWYRFPGHYLVPDGVNVQFIKSEFNGLLPRHFDRSTANGTIWKRDATRNTPSGLNDLNKENADQYVDVSTCDYLVDLDLVAHPPSKLSRFEPRYAVDSSLWDRVSCLPFLDAQHSPLLSRTLWFPLTTWTEMNSYGDYCLLRNKVRAKKRESRGSPF